MTNKELLKIMSRDFKQIVIINNTNQHIARFDIDWIIDCVIDEKREGIEFIGHKAKEVLADVSYETEGEKLTITINGCGRYLRKN